MSIVLRILNTVFFVGWLVPLWLAGHFLLSWASGIATNRIDSFPHLHFAEYCFSVALVWLLLVFVRLSFLVPSTENPGPLDRFTDSGV